MHFLVDLREAGAGAQAPETEVGLHRRDRPRSSAIPPSPPSRAGWLPGASFPQHHHLVVIDILHALGQKEPQNLHERSGHAQRTIAQNVLPVALAGGLILTLSRARVAGRPLQESEVAGFIRTPAETPHLSPPCKAKVKNTSLHVSVEAFTTGPERPSQSARTPPYPHTKNTFTSFGMQLLCGTHQPRQQIGGNVSMHQHTCTKSKTDPTMVLTPRNNISMKP